MAKKKSNFLGILVFMLLLLALFPLIMNLTKKDEESGTVIEGTNTITCYSCDVKWQENMDLLNLESGEFVLDVLATRIFVNVEGVGVGDLEFEVEEILMPNDKSTFFYSLSPQTNVIKTFFCGGEYVNVNLYAEYDGINYLIDSQKVNIDVESMWSPFE